MPNYEKVLKIIRIFKNQDTLEKDVGRVTFPNLLPGKDRPDQQVQTVDNYNQFKIQSGKVKGSGQEKDVERILFDNSRAPEPAGITTNFNHQVSSTQNQAGAQTQYTKEHEGLHYLMGEIQNKYGKNAVDSLYSRFNQKIHPDDSKVIDAYMINREYTDPNHRETERVHFLRDILTDPIVRQEFIKNAKHYQLTFNMNRMKNSWKEIRNHAHSIRAEHL